MKNTHKFILCTLFIAISMSSYAISDSDFALKIASQFSTQWKTTQPEKVYLHTDKPYYSAGENIWVKGYLINATTHFPKSLSQFLYVELINKSDEVISRVKIKKDSLGFFGHIPLTPEIQAGNYALRAYTSWMQNSTSDFFFSKNIYIGNTINDNMISSISYGKNNNGKVMATITLTDAMKNGLSDKKIDVYESWNNPQKTKKTYTTDKNGQLNLQLTIDSTLSINRVIEISTNDPKINYKNKFFLPPFSSDYDVQFFPEGGNLLANQPQTIGFKAIGADGLSTEISGKIFTTKNDEIIDIATEHNGMGKFTMQVDSGVSYYALVKSKNGKEKRFNLPETQQIGISIHVVFNRAKFWYEVKNSSKIADNALYLLVHCRGRILDVRPLTELSGQIAESELPQGIVSMSVIDTLGNTYCERLCFVRNTTVPIANMTTNKTEYGKREAVDLNFNIQSSTGKPIIGNYSISITDSRVVKADTLAGNILTNLLLTSDLKGYIEEPAGYFSKNPTIDRVRLDILMLTQGWKRFSTADVVKGKFIEPQYFMEAGQVLTGKVVDVGNKPVQNCNVTMLIPELKTMKMSMTDSKGQYFIDGIEYADSTKIKFSTNKKVALADVTIKPDKDEFPESKVFIPLLNATDQNSSNDFLRQSKEKYYTEGGMRVINLDGVTVKGTKKEQNANNSIYSKLADVKISSEKLEEFSGLRVLDVLAMQPGIQVDLAANTVSIRGRGMPLFILNDLPTNITDVSFLEPSIIEEISILRDTKAAVFGPEGGNGVIAITLKKGEIQTKMTPVSQVEIRAFGYQRPTEFYMPKYEVDSVRMTNKADLRTTIYWNPSLMSDRSGNVNVQFYTADNANDYSVELEGISPNGEIIRQVRTIKRK